jgi:hypothetical protein
MKPIKDRAKDPKRTIAAYQDSVAALRKATGWEHVASRGSYGNVIAKVGQGRVAYTGEPHVISDVYMSDEHLGPSKSSQPTAQPVAARSTAERMAAKRTAAKPAIRKVAKRAVGTRNNQEGVK